MLTFEEIMNLTPDEFSEKWKTGEIQEASLNIICAYEHKKIYPPKETKK